MNIFKVRIRELRKGKNVSQTKLALAVGVDKSTVCKWESGDRLPSWEVAQRISNYFSVTLEYLLGITNDSQKEASFEDFSVFAVQNTIYEDESDREICDMFITMEKNKKDSDESTLAKTRKNTIISTKALEFAQEYDCLDLHGQEVLDAVLAIEKKRVTKEDIYRSGK